MTQALDHIQKQIDDLQKLESNMGKLIIGAATGWEHLSWSAMWCGLFAAPPPAWRVVSNAMWRCFDPLPFSSER